MYKHFSYSVMLPPLIISFQSHFWPCLHKKCCLFIIVEINFRWNSSFSFLWTNKFLHNRDNLCDIILSKLSSSLYYLEPELTKCHDNQLNYKSLCTTSSLHKYVFFLLVYINTLILLILIKKKMLHLLHLVRLIMIKLFKYKESYRWKIGIYSFTLNLKSCFVKIFLGNLP